jgi:uncharacterized protein (DUF2141 family)
MKMTKQQTLWVMAALVLATGWVSPTSTGSGRLVVELDNVRSGTGAILVSVYSSEDDFLLAGRGDTYRFAPTLAGSQKLSLDAVPFGTVGVAVFHDLNDNGRLDTNLMGIPTEPFAFSGKPGSKFRAPRFREIQFDFSRDQQRISARLEKWWQ